MDLAKPYVICHMMTTIDGKIASGDETDVLGDYFDLYTKTEDKLNCKNWLIGRVTMQMFAEAVGTPLPIFNNEIANGDFVANNKNQPFMFAVDSKGLLRWKGNSIKLSNVNEELHLVVLVTNATPKNYLSYLQQKEISYIICGDEKLDFQIALQKIKDNFEVDKLILEGGGLLNGSLMSLNLIDEISLLLTPRILNKSDSPSLFENKTNDIVLKDYKLSSLEKVEKDCVWLRYKIK